MTGHVLIIAEAGVNHNGDVERALELVGAARRAGADVVKFQHFRAGSIVAQGTKTAAYQEMNTGASDQFEMLRALELDLEDFSKIASRCRDEGIAFLCTAFDLDAAETLVNFGMKHMKIPSGEMTNAVMLRAYAKLGLPVIVSTGMATLDEVGASLAVLNDGGARDVTLLQCTSLYPAPPETLNMRAMVTMREKFGLPVGFSDHSLGDHASLAAVALGASVVEKHFTLDCTLPGPDHKASLEPEAMAAMVSRIREVEAMLGDGVKQPVSAELDMAAIARRSWHAVRDIKADAVIEDADVSLLRPLGGVSSMDIIVGRRVLRDIPAGRPIMTEDIG